MMTPWVVDGAAKLPDLRLTAGLVLSTGLAPVAASELAQGAKRADHNKAVAGARLCGRCRPTCPMQRVRVAVKLIVVVGEASTWLKGDRAGITGDGGDRAV